MDIFNKYARYYDLLYNDKNYNTEVSLLEKVFSTYAKRPVHDVLDLGCGTGGHSILLAQQGYQVVGVDQSDIMLNEAEAKVKDFVSLQSAPKFQKGDVRNFCVDQKFDAVISMFAVMSYMVSNDDVLDAMKTAKSHLRPGGLFFFDAWFGPAVLMEKPSHRYKIVKSGENQIIRFVQPSLSIENQTVDVKYKVLQISNNVILNEIDEVHTMRYFFPQEIVHYLKSAGFATVFTFPFLDIDQPLSEKDWNFAVVALNTSN